MASEITLRSCSSKWVNNHMEVNDRPNERSGGDGANTTKALIWLKGYIHNGYLPVHFLMSLNAGGNICSSYVYFLTSMNSAFKTARSCVYFLTSDVYFLKLLDDKFACPQHNNANRGACPPSFIAFNSVVGMKVYL
jgi:hypothetical protein